MINCMFHYSQTTPKHYNKYVINVLETIDHTNQSLWYTKNTKSPAMRAD